MNVIVQKAPHRNRTVRFVVMAMEHTPAEFVTVTRGDMAKFVSVTAHLISRVIINYVWGEYSVVLTSSVMLNSSVMLSSMG